MNKLTMLAAAATLALAGCGKSSGPKAEAAAAAKPAGEAAGGGGCAAFKVTVDGKPVDGLAHGLAYTMVNEGYRTEMVEITNKPEVTCENVLARSRPPIDGEVSVRVFAGPAQGLMTDAYTELVNVTQIAAKPAKVGDKMTICVKETTFTPNAGVLAGKSVTYAGSFTGDYCGDKQM